MATHRLERIAGAGGVEPATRPEQGRQNQLVRADGQHEQRDADGSGHASGARPHAHACAPRTGRSPAVSSARSRAWSSAKPRTAEDAPALGGRARTTSRAPGGSEARRDASTCRRRRFTLLRVTAAPTDRETIKPARTGGEGEPAPAEWATVAGSRCTTSTRPPWTPRERRTVVEKSTRRRSREPAGSTSVRPTVGCDPWNAGQRGWRGRPGSACAGGSHGSWPVGGCWAGTCACSLVGSRPGGLVVRCRGRRWRGGRRLTAGRPPPTASAPDATSHGTVGPRSGSNRPAAHAPPPARPARIPADVRPIVRDTPVDTNVLWTTGCCPAAGVGSVTPRSSGPSPPPGP